MEDAIGVAAIKWHGRTGYDLASLTLTGLLEVHPEHWTGPRETMGRCSHGESLLSLAPR